MLSIPARASNVSSVARGYFLHRPEFISIESIRRRLLRLSVAYCHPNHQTSKIGI